MAEVLNQLDNSTLSLSGNGINPIVTEAGWGYVDTTGERNPTLSSLHNHYSVDGDPNIKLLDFNSDGKTMGKVPLPSLLDELDQNAPKLTPRGVVSQAYKSSAGNNYKDLGPAGGRY
jgi:hypothetical protein